MGPGTTEATFPRIELEGVDQEQAQAVQEILTAAEEHAQHIAGQKAGLILSMLRLRKPISTGAKRTPRKARKATKHSRYAETMRARSAHVWTKAGCQRDSV